MRVGYHLYDAYGAVDHVGIVDRNGLDFGAVMKLSGGNLGNFAFKYATRRLIADPVVPATYGSDPDELRKQIDVLVIAEANLVNPSIDYGSVADFVRALDRPVFLCGVGSQAPLGTTAKKFPEIPDGTWRFLEEVSKRTPTIFVRGEFTKSLLTKRGITNVKAVGCPSLLINPSPSLWKRVGNPKAAGRLLNRLTVTEGVYPAAARTEDLDAAERYLFQHVQYGGAHYVGQNQVAIVGLGLGVRPPANQAQLRNLGRYVAPGLPTPRFSRIVRDQARAFARADEWMSYLGTRSGVIGTRIHGNMLALQAGTPALPIAHDVRTKELCEAMAMPHVSASDVAGLTRIDDLRDLFSALFDADLAALDEHRLGVAREYHTSLRELGLQTSDHLDRLVG